METINKKLKILTEFGNEANKSLLIELDKTISDQLSIDANGMVDTVEFIQACLAAYNCQAPKRVAMHGDKPDLYQLIFDTDLAVDTWKRQ